jgi:hypothetical protein
VKAARGEAFLCERGGNRAGRHQRTAGWAGREAEDQWGEGELPVGQKKWPRWAERPDGPTGRWADWAESEGKILFRIKI